MSTDFLSDEELAELEAELDDLDMGEESTAEPEAESAGESAPESTVEDEPEFDDEDLGTLEAALNAESDEPEVPEVPELEETAEVTEAETEAEVAEIPEPEPELPESADAPESAEDITGTANNSLKSDGDDFAQVLASTSSAFDPRQLKKDLAFSENNLDDAFISQAGMFAHYSGLAHRAARRYDQLVQQEKLVYAMLDQEVRQGAADAGEKITEAAIKNRILLDSRHRKIIERMLDAKAVAAMTKDGCEAFKQRRDMLIQVGANMREEFKGEARLKAARATTEDAKERALKAMS